MSNQEKNIGMHQKIDERLKEKNAKIDKVGTLLIEEEQIINNSSINNRGIKSK